MASPTIFHSDAVDSTTTNSDTELLTTQNPKIVHT